MIFIFICFLSIVSFVAFPESKEAIFANSDKKEIIIETSGSLGLFYDGKCHQTYGNETLDSSDSSEWCSNIAKDKNDPTQNPFIQYSIKGKQMRVKKYAVRNGCCRYDCCCTEDGQFIESTCCCLLYSYSLQASNDNKAWKVLHRVEKDANFNGCETKIFELNEVSAPYKYIRFVQDEEWPECPKCMQINQIELYGETISSELSPDDTSEEEEESISIIGRVKRSD